MKTKPKEFISDFILHKGQVDIIKHILQSDAMYYTIVCPRQWGKSVLLSQLVLYYSINHEFSISMVTSPIYAQAKKIFKEISRAIKDSGIVTNINNSDFEIELINGSVIKFRSVSNADNLRGETLNYLYCDEAAQYKEDVFDKVLRSFLTIKGKKCFFFSTPRGKNWFYKMYNNDKNSNRYISYKGLIDDNPFANKEEIEDARKVLPEAIFRQEYGAEFIEDGSECFVNINACSTIDKWPDYNPNIKYYAGIDIGRANDFTVLTIIGDDNKIYYILRTNRKDWSQIVDEVVNVLNKFNPINTLVEINGVGDPIYEMIKKKYSNVDVWRTTNESKQQLVEELILSFQEATINIPTKEFLPELHDEINDFSFNWSKQTRKIVYGARSGHDDMIISLSLSNHCKKHYANKGKYYIM